jgi:hypothetical protein
MLVLHCIVEVQTVGIQIEGRQQNLDSTDIPTLP